MVITDANKISEKATATPTGITLTRVYEIEFTGEFDAVAAATTTFGDVPGFSSPQNGNLYLTDSEATLPEDARPSGETGNPSVCTLTHRYAAQTFDPTEISPLDRPVEISSEPAEFTTTVQKDIEGTYFLNSAGDMIDPLPEVPIACAGISFRRNEASPPVAALLFCRKTTNDAAWHGVPEDYAMLEDIRYEKRTENWRGTLISYFACTYVVVIREDGWRLKVIDNGYQVIYEDEKRTATDDQGNPTSVPILLDGAGAKSDTPVIFPEEGYRVHGKTSWVSILNLPNPFSS